MSVLEFKDKGNNAFKLEEYDSAINLYSLAINDPSCTESTLRSTLLLNRAAAYNKLSRFSDAQSDCLSAIALNPSSVKAYYRCAVAQHSLGESKKAFDNLSKLLAMEPSNKEGITLMRDVRARLLDNERNSSPISKLLASLKQPEIKLKMILREIASLCSDDKFNAIDLGRRAGFKSLQEYIALESLFEASGSDRPDLVDDAVVMLRIIALACSHSEFVDLFVSMEDSRHGSQSCSGLMTDDNKLRFNFICQLLQSSVSAVSSGAIHAMVQILKSVATNNEAKLAKLSTADPAADHSSQAYIPESAATAVFSGLKHALTSGLPEIFVTAADALMAVLSEAPQYFGVEKIVDARYENLEERKERQRAQKHLRDRSRRHGQWALQAGLSTTLFELLDAENPLMRQRSAVCIGHFIRAIDNEDLVKSAVESLISSTPTYSDGVTGESIAFFRKRASLESALFMSSKPDLGVWALDQREGVQQLLVLVSSGDSRCQEVAAEVMCQAASTEGGGPLLAPVLSSGTLQTLLMASNQGVRAAAAATMTKLSIKAKAFESEDGSDLTTVLNTALGVLRSSPLSSSSDKKTKSSSSSTSDASKSTDKGLVSFSKLDGSKAGSKGKDGASKGTTGATSVANDYAASVANMEGGLAYVSVERAVEVLAALVGKTFVKEEIVHGSYRVAPSIGALLSIEVDPRSTAAYGIAHVLAALTVSNHELRAKALAEKDMSPEQYEQLAELQRIKTKDESGNDIEERKPDADPDTELLVSKRIQKVVSANGIAVLLGLIGNTSSQTKEAACRALRQICVEETARGVFVQRGGLKAASAVATDEECPKATRREAAHAIAKALVTTNPTLLSEHVRLGCISPLLLLCRDVDASNLQQFEACLALTNLMSCGETEQERLVSEKGVHNVHYLMFSDHLMVRRAATEVFCNMPTHEAVLKILRKPDMARLWLGLCEEWEKDRESGDGVIETDLTESESYKTARAAAGILASASSDVEVCDALLAEGCATTVVALLNSNMPELVHRILVVSLEFITAKGWPAAKHLLEGGVVPALHVGSRLGIVQLGSLCKEVGLALSAALKDQPPEAPLVAAAVPSPPSLPSPPQTSTPTPASAQSTVDFYELD